MFTATAAVLQSLNVTPLTATVKRGFTEQYTATGTYSDGSSTPITSGVTWASSNPIVATVDNTGLATVKASSGSSNITAVYQGVTGNAPGVVKHQRDAGLLYL